jgi:hypothetical protein
MKLRIRGNSIRLRLKQSEAAKIAAGRAIAEETRFPGSVLTYCLETTADDQVSASFSDGSLAIRLPQSRAAEWADGDEVSIVAEQDLGEAGVLSLLIEKDFQCLSPGHHRPGEDDEDTYPHPEA